MKTRKKIKRQLWKNNCVCVLACLSPCTSSMTIRMGCFCVHTPISLTMLGWSYCFRILPVIHRERKEFTSTSAFWDFTIWLPLDTKTTSWSRVSISGAECKLLTEKSFTDWVDLSVLSFQCDQMIHIDWFSLPEYQDWHIFRWGHRLCSWGLYSKLGRGYGWVSTQQLAEELK